MKNHMNLTYISNKRATVLNAAQSYPSSNVEPNVTDLSICIDMDDADTDEGGRDTDL